MKVVGRGLWVRGFEVVVEIAALKKMTLNGEDGEEMALKKIRLRAGVLRIRSSWALRGEDEPGERGESRETKQKVRFFLDDFFLREKN